MTRLDQGAITLLLAVVPVLVAACSTPKAHGDGVLSSPGHLTSGSNSPEIYDRVLDAVMPTRERPALVSARPWYPGLSDLGLLDKFPGADRTALRSAAEVNADASRFEASEFFGDVVLLTGDDDPSRDWSLPWREWWRWFRECHQGQECFWALSRIGLGASGDTAMVTVAINCRDGTGRSCLVYLVKRNGSWTVAEIVLWAIG